MSEFDFVTGEPGRGCKKCGRDEETRIGYCFDCASAGDERMAKLTVTQHTKKAVEYLRRSRNKAVPQDMRDEFQWRANTHFHWAYERLSRTGAYARGGTFDREGYKWRMGVKDE